MAKKTLTLNNSQGKPLDKKAFITSNLLASVFCKKNEKASFLDKKNIVWKWVNNKWIGKRSVWTFDLRACWLEDTTNDNIKSWWCGGKDADYTEIFLRDEN